MLPSRYVWLFVLAVAGLNLALYRSRLRTLAGEGRVAPADASRFLRLAAVWLGGGVLLAAVLQWAAGWPSPFCLYSRPWSDPFVPLAWGLTALWWAAALAWVFALGGAELLARVSPALGRDFPGRQWSPRAAKRFWIVLTLAAVLGVVMLTRAGPPCEPFTIPPDGPGRSAGE